MNSAVFTLGDLYAHDVIMKELKIGNSGGIRVSTNSRSKVARVVLFSTSEQECNPQENPYNDFAEGSILTYTGTGKIGHQNLSGQNLRITQQGTDYFPIYVFSLLHHRKSAGSPDKRWRFSGIYKYLDHSFENQVDLLGSDRNAWIFKLLRLEIRNAHPELEVSITKAIAQAYADPSLSSKALLGETTSFSANDILATVGKMNGLEPTAFERFVKNALISSRFRDVRVTKKSSDGGVDVIARMPFSLWPVEGQIIQVQAKRWLRPVGRREVAELRGSLIPRALGVLITTGNYARSALVEADRPNLLPISLIDGHRFAIVAMQLALDVA
ncbi:MAG: restriction endonuclease [Verrucomicrobiota bacterium]